MKYFFTFGTGQQHANHYVEITAKDEDEARDMMVDKFGRKWAFVYPSHDKMTDYGRWKYKLLVALVSTPDIPDMEK